MILLNASFSWLSRGITALLALLVTPFIVAYVGKDAYGLWLLLIGFCTTCGLLDPGLYQALNYSLASLQARGEVREARRALATGFTIYLVMGALVLLAFLALLLGALDLFKVDPALRQVSRHVIWLLGPITALSLVIRTFEVILIARERYFQVYSVDALGNLARTALLLLLLPLGGGLMTMAHVYFWTNLAGYAAIFWMSRRFWPGAAPPRPGWHTPSMRQLFDYAKGMMLLTMGRQLQDQFPLLYLGTVVDTSQVASYGVGARLVTQQRDFASSGLGVMQPRYSALMAQGDHGQARDLFLRASLYSALLATFVGMGLLALARPFFMVWMGPAFADSASVALLLTVPTILRLSMMPCEMVLLGIGRHRVVGWIYLAEFGVILLLAWPTVRYLGMLGLAGLIGLAILAPHPLVLPPVACRHVGVPVGRFWRQGPWPAGRVCLATLLPLFALEQLWAMDNWGSFFIGFLVYVLIWTACALLVGLPAPEREFWLGKLKETWGRLTRRTGTHKEGRDA